MYITLWWNFRGHPNILVYAFFSENWWFQTKRFTWLLGLLQLYEQNPLEKCFIFTSYSNCTLALKFTPTPTQIQTNWYGSKSTKPCSCCLPFSDNWGILLSTFPFPGITSNALQTWIDLFINVSQIYGCFFPRDLVTSHLTCTQQWYFNTPESTLHYTLVIATSDKPTSFQVVRDNLCWNGMHKGSEPTFWMNNEWNWH